MRVEDIPCYCDDRIVMYYPQGNVEGPILIEPRDENMEPPTTLFVRDEDESVVFSYLSRVFRYLHRGVECITPQQRKALCKDLPLYQYVKKKSSPWRNYLNLRVRNELYHFYHERYEDSLVKMHQFLTAQFVIDKLGLRIVDLVEDQPLVGNLNGAVALREWGVCRYAKCIKEALHLRKRSYTSYRKTDGMYLVKVPDYFTEMDWRTIIADTPYDFTKELLFSTFDGFEGTGFYRKMRFDIRKLYQNPMVRDGIMDTGAYQISGYWTEQFLCISHYTKNQLFRLLPINLLGLWNRCHLGFQDIDNPAYRFDYGYVRICEGVSDFAMTLLFLIEVCNDQFEITPEQTTLRVTFFERFYRDLQVNDENLWQYAISELAKLPNESTTERYLNLENNQFQSHRSYPTIAKDWETAISQNPKNTLSIASAMNQLQAEAASAFIVKAAHQSFGIDGENPRYWATEAPITDFVPIHENFSVKIDTATGQFVIENFD